MAEKEGNGPSAPFGSRSHGFTSGEHFYPTQKVVEYKLISQDTPGEISELINKFLKEGWQLYGGLMITTTGGGILYLQQLAKYEV